MTSKSRTLDRVLTDPLADIDSEAEVPIAIGILIAQKGNWKLKSQQVEYQLKGQWLRAKTVCNHVVNKTKIT